MKSIRLSLSALCLLMIIAVSSCSKNADRIEALIPSESAAIVAIDGQRIIENAGGKYDGNGITLPATLKHMVGDDTADKLSKFKGVDLKNMYFFGEMSGNGALVAPVTDEAAVLAFFKDLGLEAKDVDGYNVISQGGTSLLVRDNVLWIVGKSDKKAVEYVEKTRSDASSDGSLADSKWRSDVLAKDHAVTTLINLAKMPMIADQLGSQISDDMPGAEMMKKLIAGSMAIESNLDGLEATISYSAFDKDGQALSFNPEAYGMKMKDIDTDFLQYLNDKDVLVIAGGVPEDYPWDKVLEALSNQPGMPKASVMAALPYLQAIDGTIAVAAGPSNGVASFAGKNVAGSWDVLLYAGLKPGKAAEFYKQLVALLQSMNMTVNEADENNSNFTFNGMTIYLGVRGNNLIVATREITDGHKDSVFSASEFSGLSGVALLRLAKTSQLCTELSMPFGLFSRIAQDGDDKATWLIEETDTEGKFLENIINYVASLGF